MHVAGQPPRSRMLARHQVIRLNDMSPQAAECWVKSALAEAAALHEHDDQLYPRTADPEEMAVAGRLHQAWGEWADEAQDLLRRMAELRRHVPSMPRAAELEHEVGRARAMLTLTPEKILASRAQLARGEVYSAEEVRRALGISDHTGRPRRSPAS